MSPPTVPEQPTPVLDLHQIAVLLHACAGHVGEPARHPLSGCSWTPVGVLDGPTTFADAAYSAARHSDAMRIDKMGPLTGSGVHQLLERRCQDAGPDPIHPHQLRHTMAPRRLPAGWQETDLMRLAGWRSWEVVGRYPASAADERAPDAHRRMGLGQIAADERWMRTPDRTAADAPARSGLRGEFAREIDPDGDARPRRQTRD